MPFDQHSNLAVSLVADAPVPPDSGTSLTVAVSHGARFPAPPFNVTIWAAGELPSPVNAEVARVTAVVGDVLTLVRAAEPPAPARTILVGDLLAETITAKALGDIESGVNFPNLASETDLTVPGLSTLHFVTAQALDTVDATVHEQLLVEGDLRVDGPSVLNGQVLVTGNLQASGTITADGGFTTGGDVSAATGTFTGTLTAQDLNVQQVNATDINVTHLDADTISATTSVTSPLGQFDGLGTTPLNATQLTTGTVPDARLSVNVLKHTGGYPGGTTTFLRADGTFTTTPSGVPTAHHLTHETGGTDPIVALSGAVITTGTVADARLTVNVLKFTGGYPGGTVNFLRADGSFAAPGGGAVAAHHLTHEVGGSDPITGALSISTLTTSGLVTVGGDVVTTAAVGLIRTNTADGSDTKTLSMFGGGGTTLATTRGAYLTCWGNEAVGAPGSIQFVTGDTVTAQILFYTGAAILRGAMHPSGGFSWGTSAVDPGFNNLGLDGDILFRANTSDLRRIDDNGTLRIAGGSAVNPANGASLSLFGKGFFNGEAYLDTSTTGSIFLQIAGTTRLRVHPSGGVSVGSVDPGVNNLGVQGTVTALGGEVLLGTGGQTKVRANTVDGADTGFLSLCGGGTIGDTRGSYITVYGNESGIPGAIQLIAGNVTPSGYSGCITFQTGSTGTLRGQMFPSGGFTWGGGADAGPGILFVAAGALASGQAFTYIDKGLISVGAAGAPVNGQLITFQNSNGVIGVIAANAGATGVVYGTASDARLKRDRGRLTETVLAQTVVHVFDWPDGSPGRGVFAQEAAEVAPFAVVPGTDDRDEHGLLVQPWQVDYSAFVPDLIVGWQQQQVELVALRAELVALKQALGG